MATPGQLVEAMAAVLGISQATVALYDRVLAEHGLRSKGGRGRSAAKVTSRDAANLLIAAIASPVSGSSTREAARACKVYGALPNLKKASWPENFTKFGLPILAHLPKKHSLGEALSALIDAAGKGEQFKRPIQKHFAFWHIEFDGPRPWAEILADVSPRSRGVSNMARLVYFDEATRGEKPGNLIHRATVTFNTIRALGSLVKDS
jgi:hypothetical protein